jgi:transcriptional regulator with XRE-family HTH domain
MLRKARFNKNLTQKDLATYLGVSQSYISKLETRKTKSVSVEMILNMSAILEVNPIDLFLFIAELPPTGK